MSTRLDAHAHFFYPGFAQSLPASCRRQQPDEVTLYSAYAAQHDIAAVVAIGYEGEAWAAGNNAYLAGLAAQHDWVRPVAFVQQPERLTVAQLQKWQLERFVGITLYVFTPEDAAALAQVPGEVWSWLADHAWLISVNSTGGHWTTWQLILAQHPTLTILVAHLGLPPATTARPSLDKARSALTKVIALAKFANVHVKFSGFYALAEPAYAFPHRAAWPYAQTILQSFGLNRVLWASDFSPALEFVSFPQTVAVIEEFPWLGASEHQAIFHDNLARLLARVDERKSVA